MVLRWGVFIGFLLRSTQSTTRLVQPPTVKEFCKWLHFPSSARSSFYNTLKGCDSLLSGRLQSIETSATLLNCKLKCWIIPSSTNFKRNCTLRFSPYRVVSTIHLGVNQTGNVRKAQYRGPFVQPLLQWKNSTYYMFWVCVCVCVCSLR